MHQSIVECFNRLFPKGFAIASCLVFLSGCLNYSVNPLLSLESPVTGTAANGKITVVGTETFDRTIVPLTVMCSAANYHIAFSDAARQLITIRIAEKLGQATLSEYEKIDVIVDDTMMRTMSIHTATYSGRFDVETRITLSAQLIAKGGSVKTISITDQALHTSGAATEGGTCDVGRIQIEESLPILLERAVDTLAEKILET